MVGCLGAPLFLNDQTKAAERFEIHFDGMSIPISIKELIDWSNFKEAKNSELSNWLNLLGFKDREGLTKFLNAPLVRDKSMARQLLRSWTGRKLIDEISDLIFLDDDSTGFSALETLENLLEKQDVVTMFDLLNSFEAKIIHLDLDGWIEVANNWRKELKKQEKLISDLFLIDNRSNLIEKKYFLSSEVNETDHKLIPIILPHRKSPLEIEIWNPSIQNNFRSNWIILMPGLGGNRYHFRWLARSLSHHGWPVVVLQHPGSDTKAVESLLDGSLPLPGAEVIPDRLKDLMGIIEAKKSGEINIPGKKIILMGHSLGALTSFLASGINIDERLEDRCNKVLNNLSLTNLSALLQCQLADVDLPERKNIKNLSAIVGINSFGSLLWSKDIDNQINVPLFLTGGTFDLITPSFSEQFDLLLSSSSNPLSRVLLIERASHFSPIRVEGQMNQINGQDLFQLGESVVGFHPLSVQSILAFEIINFLDNLERQKGIPPNTNQIKGDLKFHILDRDIIGKLINSQ